MTISLSSSRPFAGRMLCLAGALCALSLAAAGPAAAAFVPTPPVTALLSPDGGRLEVEESLPVESCDGVSCINFVLPGEAENPDVRVAGQTIVRWTSLPQLFKHDGDLSQRRDVLMAEQARLMGTIEAVKARAALWTSRPDKAGVQDLEQREARLRTVIPALGVEQAELERRLALLKEELGSLPESPPLGRLITVYLAKPVTGKVKVAYNYTLRNCWWRPVYSFDALPGKDEVAVRFEAEVSQLTGMDWQQTRVSLSSQGVGPREPGPMQDWIVDSKPMPMPRMPAPAGYEARKMVLSPAAGDGAVDTALRNARVTADTTGVYALWTPETNGLPEGVSRLFIADDVWKTPLQWLARPTVGDGRVWLTASHELAPDAVWPAGEADYSVDGKPAGQGLFKPKDGRAELFFGPDPRVTVLTVRDRQRGESGFIAKSRNWTWAWTYKVSNGHKKEVTVRLERPAPQIVDQAVSVKYDDVPPAQEDKARHLLYWNVKVPAAGSAEVKHAVTISSPTELPLLPDAP